jgi:epoxyqueuosine reductase
MRSAEIKALARECGFELAGVAAAGEAPEAVWHREWVARGMAGEMGYLSGRRGDLRADARSLLPSARSIVCAGKLYNGPEPHSDRFDPAERAWISRYAWGDDYHDVLRSGLERLIGLMHAQAGDFDSKICVDTAPLLERAWARRAGLGWIGRNTCLINQASGSWFFLAEALVSLELEPDAPPPDRCGSCRRCIDACPTAAIVPTGRAEPAWALDARRCIAYLTIELRGAIPESLRAATGNHVFGCDICQEVCPWNRKAPRAADPAFTPRLIAPPLERLAAISEEEFRQMFRGSPVKRARYAGFLRNVAVAMGNSGSPAFRAPLEKLAAHPDPLVREHAQWALAKVGQAPAAPRLP